MAQWQTEDRSALLTYCGLDTAATARVRRAIYQEEEWNTPRCQRLFQVHEAMSKLGAELHSTGFLVIEPQRRKLIQHLKALSTRRHRELVAHLGRSRNPAFRGTDNDMRALLYERHRKEGINCYGLEEPEAWDTVMWTNDTCITLAVDKEALLRIFINPITPMEVREAIALFWRAKAPGKALTTWVDGKEVLEHIGEDGRHRADWNSAGTETMRWASELMTLPQDKDDESLGGRLPNIRSMYGAAKGYDLYHWDWKSQELRMLAAISKDLVLTRNIAAGNVYIADARAWFPKQLQARHPKDWNTMSAKEFKTKEPECYRQCKVGHLAAQYMAGVPTMWTQMLMQDQSVRFGTTKGIRELFHTSYKRTVEYAQEEHASVAKTGYSEGRILHGRRYYPAPPPITETCNYPVQRTAGEMGALAMLAIADTLKKHKVRARILTNEHDAGTMEVHGDPVTRRDVSAIVHEATQGPWRVDGQDYDFPIDEHWGATWAEACEG